MKRAVRQFKDQPLSEDEVVQILRAGRRAQSSKNTQPWQFIAIQDKSILAGAALGVAILTPDPAERFSIMLDAGQAAAYMQLAAWELKIGSCLATIYDLDAARDLLGYPSEYHLYIAISFGYPVNEAYLTTPPQKGGRRPLEEIIHWERW